MLYNEIRPHTFDDFKGQENVVKSIRNQSIKDNFFGVYILGGKYGAGKTTMSRIIALAANCEHKDEHGNPCLECEHCKAILSGNCQDFMELDGASHNGVEDVRNLIEDVSYRPSFLKKKVYIIDEVHKLSDSAFNSLLKTLEEPPEYVIFILCTTDAESIPVTVRSRAAKYVFQEIPEKIILEHLAELADKCKIPYEMDALKLLAKNADGSMRNANVLFEQASLEGKITLGAVQESLGLADMDILFELLDALLAKNMVKAISLVMEQLSAGKEITYLVSDLLEIVTDCLIVSCSSIDSITNTESYLSRITILCQEYNGVLFSTLSTTLLDLYREAKNGLNRTLLTVKIADITKRLTLTDTAALVSRVEELERQLKEISSGNVKVGLVYEQDYSESDSGKEDEDTVEVSEDVEISENEGSFEDITSVVEQPEDVLGIENQEEIERYIAMAEEAVLVEEAESVDIPEIQVPEWGHRENLAEENESQAVEPENEFHITGPDNDEVDEKIEVQGDEETDVETQMELEDNLSGDQEISMFDLGNVFSSLMNGMSDTYLDNDDAEVEDGECKTFNADAAADTAEPKTGVSKKAQSKLEEVSSLIEGDDALYSAVTEGCICEIIGDSVVYKTPLEPLYKLIKANFEAFQIHAEVVLDHAVEI